MALIDNSEIPLAKNTNLHLTIEQKKQRYKEQRKIYWKKYIRTTAKYICVINCPKCGKNGYLQIQAHKNIHANSIIGKHLIVVHSKTINHKTVYLYNCFLHKKENQNLWDKFIGENSE